MAYPKNVAETLLIKSARHCCTCRKFKGTRLIIHHIVQEADGGTDTEDNGIPLCFECHAEVGSYNNFHPGGRKYQPSELRRVRDLWFEYVATHPTPPDAAPTQTVIGNHNIVGHEINVNPRVVKQSIVQPGPEHISDEQAFKVRERIIALSEKKKKSGKGGTPGEWYSKLYRHFRVTSYKLLPRTQFEDAIAWLQKQGALQRPKLRRTNNNEWRKTLYTAIWARAREIGMEKGSVYAFAFRILDLKSQISSLSDLGERDLESLHRALFALPRNRPNSK